MIYFYHDDAMPTFLITVYAKANKGDLTGRERSTMKKIVDEMVKQYKGRKP